MTSPQFITFVERKLRNNKIAKIVPDRNLLAKVYVSMERGRRLEHAAKKLEKIKLKGFRPPRNLTRLVQQELKKKPHLRWDAAIEAIIRR